MARPTSWYEETGLELEDEAPEVLPEELQAPVQLPAQPERRVLEHAWLVLAVLGLALAGAAAIWYVRLRPTPPAALSVPRVVGLNEAGAVRALTKEGFRVRAVEESSSSGRLIVTSQRRSPRLAWSAAPR